MKDEEHPEHWFLKSQEDMLLDFSIKFLNKLAEDGRIDESVCKKISIMYALEFIKHFVVKRFKTDLKDMDHVR